MILAIAKIEKKDQLNNVFGKNAFTGRISSDGNAPATHCWCGWLPNSFNSTEIKSLISELIESGDVSFYETSNPFDVLSSLSLKRIEE